MRKGKAGLLIICGFVCLLLFGCGQAGGQADGQEQQKQPEVKEEIVGVYEAEEAELSSNLAVKNVSSGFSGTGYVEGFEQDGDACVFRVAVDEDGFYDLRLTAANIGGYKENYVLVDETAVGNLVSRESKFTEETIKRTYLSAGEHTVAVSKFWGYISLDKLTVLKSPELPEDYYEVSAKLCNENADDCAKRLMSYLADNYGKNVLSGQYCDGGLYGHEMACIWAATGNFPAVVGLDMIEYSPSRAANGSEGKSIEQAIEAWEAGAVVTICWHWNAPEKYLTGQWYSGFYKEYTNIDLDKIMNGEDEEGYKLLLSDMDVIAKELQKLQKAGVPVLWRPLHEASGGWFWWGDCKAESYLELYRLMYDKFTNEYGLNNLIWVWNGQSKDWYPGDDVVDIVGEDIYPGEHVYSSQINKFMEVHDYADSGKMVVLSENGCLFDPDLVLRDGAMWGYFGTWGGEFVSKSTTLNIYSEQYTEEEMLKKVYSHENVIVLNELPNLKEYPIREEAE
ncbi:MAG: beta-mannosidase [Lachnospiraceae bacterium]|nr:beta-mannosidase [Lachnospiraceae bacterium]